MPYGKVQYSNIYQISYWKSLSQKLMTTQNWMNIGTLEWIRLKHDEVYQWERMGCKTLEAEIWERMKPLINKNCPDIRLGGMSGNTRVSHNFPSVVYPKLFLLMEVWGYIWWDFHRNQRKILKIHCAHHTSIIQRKSQKTQRKNLKIENINF